MNTKKLEAYSPLILFIILLALWQGVCGLFDIPEFIFPSPLMIGKALAEFTNPIAFAAWQTFWVTMVGFGIATPPDAALAARSADGVIIGSALIKIIGSGRPDRLDEAVRFTRAVRAALDAPTP